MDYLAAVWIFLLEIAGVICLVPNKRMNRAGWTSLGFTLLAAALLRAWPLIHCDRVMHAGVLSMPLLMLVGAGCSALYTARRISGDSLSRLLLLAPLLLGAGLWLALSPWSALSFGRWLIWAPSLCLVAWAFY